MLSLLVAGLLFFVLSPGVLLTIPPGKGGLLLSGQTSVVAALVHAVVFVMVAYLLTTVVEGFAPASSPSKSTGPSLLPPPTLCTGKKDGDSCHVNGAPGKCKEGNCKA